MDDVSGFDARAYRDALGHYASGITVVTGMCEGEAVGFTCQSFYSVSLEPPLVSFCVRNESKSWPKIQPSGHFAVNMLHWNQMEVSNGFARSEGDRWQGIEWSESELGNPIINGSLMFMECTIFAEHAAGDHTVVLGRVQRLSDDIGQCQHSPLIYYKGRYHQLIVG